MKKNLIGIIMAAGIAMSGIGCSSMPLEQNSVQIECEKSRVEMKLQKGEYLVPNKVFDIYETAACNNKNNKSQHVAGKYISKTIPSRAKKKFCSKMAKEGYSQEDTASFYDMFATTGGIVIRNSDYTPTVLMHERMHREIEKLSQKEKKEIQKAYNHFDTLYYDLDSLVKADLNWKEFFPYLADGTIKDNIEKKLKKKYPKAYEIFSRVKENAILPISSKKLETKVGSFYSSPVIPSSYGFKILKKVGGDIDESAYPQEKDGKMYIIGYSEVYGTERGAREDSEFNAKEEALKLASKNKALVSSYPTQYEVYQVEKDGKTGYVAHSLNEINLVSMKK